MQFAICCSFFTREGKSRVNSTFQNKMIVIILSWLIFLGLISRFKILGHKIKYILDHVCIKLIVNCPY